MDVSSSVVTRKYVPCAVLHHQPSTRPSLKPVSRIFFSPPTDVWRNFRPSLGYRRMAQVDDSMDATISWKVFPLKINGKGNIFDRQFLSPKQRPLLFSNFERRVANCCWRKVLDAGIVNMYCKERHHLYQHNPKT